MSAMCVVAWHNVCRKKRVVFHLRYCFVRVCLCVHSPRKMCNIKVPYVIWHFDFFASVCLCVETDA